MRLSHIHLPMGENRVRKIDAYSVKGSALGLVDHHCKCHVQWELLPCKGNWHLQVLGSQCDVSNQDSVAYEGLRTGGYPCLNDPPEQSLYNDSGGIGQSMVRH